MSNQSQQSLLALVRYYRVLTYSLISDKFFPRQERDIPAWCLATAIHLWNRKCHAEGITFSQYIQQSPGVSMARILLNYRIFAVLALYFWPLIAVIIIWKHRGNRIIQWCYALERPDLYASYPLIAFSEISVTQRRSDVFLGIFNFWDYWISKSSQYEINDKKIFEERARAANLPVVKNITLAEAEKLDGPFIIKDPREDIGLGVKKIVNYEELKKSFAPNYIIQQALQNHPELINILPPNPPLCTLRITTILTAESPRCTNAFFRIGNSNSPVDNINRGGTMVEVDLASGKMLQGLSYKGLKGLELPNENFKKIFNAKEQFFGVILPQFHEAVKLAEQAHRILCPRIISLGWDIALTPQTPILVEANTFPGSYETFHFANSYHISNQAILDKVRA